MINKQEALQSIRPGAEWRWTGNEYSVLEWVDQSQTKPTEQEVLDEIARLEALEAFEAQRQQALKASTYVTDWDERIKGKTFAQIKTLFDGATAQQKSDLLFYLLLVRALEVKD